MDHAAFCWGIGQHILGTEIHMTKHRSSPAALPLQASGGVASVLSLELRSLNAWPAPQTLLLDGWALRLAGGYTKRCNSVNATAVGATLDERQLAELEQLYARNHQPCIFRLSPLADPAVDGLLHAKGYSLQDPSLFLQRSVWAEDVSGPAIEMRTGFDARWFEGICSAHGLSESQQQWHRRILQGIAPQCGYGSITQQGQAVAWGLVVLEREAAGFYDVVVDANQRGKGLGRELMQGLMQWAAQQGARRLDLQVAGSNAVAQALYASLGFERVYGYHYRVSARA